MYWSISIIINNVVVKLSQVFSSLDYSSSSKFACRIFSTYPIVSNSSSTPGIFTRNLAPSNAGKAFESSETTSSSRHAFDRCRSQQPLKPLAAFKKKEKHVAELVITKQI
jgi:hypothetical protein